VLQMGCKLCSIPTVQFYKLHPFITIAGYSDVAHTMKGKVEKAHIAPELDANRDKVCAVLECTGSQLPVPGMLCALAAISRLQVTVCCGRSVHHAPGIPEALPHEHTLHRRLSDHCRFIE
jgi:hypothetical protein